MEIKEDNNLVILLELYNKITSIESINKEDIKEYDTLEKIKKNEVNI